MIQSKAKVSFSNCLLISNIISSISWLFLLFFECVLGMGDSWAIFGNVSTRDEPNYLTEKSC